ncbi:hypothetical protein BC827DRAFT_920836 [Russula dissimulans]|nr:hypothetical protein BC827DRAFT_920836 [Russula dissimulans]
MIAIRDPAIPLVYTPAVVNFWHVISGLYIWEFFTTLELEWSVIRGRRKYRWTIWIYSFTRLATLATIIATLVDLNAKTPRRCQVLISFQYTFACMSLASASSLIVLRINAIWNKKKVIMSISVGVWVTNATVLIVGVSRLRASWSPEQDHCVTLNVQSIKFNSISLLSSDVILLLITLVGLFRLRSHGTFSLGRLLWKQGIVWLLLAIVAEVPPALFLNWHLSAPLSVMFQFPGVVILTIAATRVYRSLTDFVTGGTHHTTESQRSRPPVRNGMQNPASQIPLNQLEVAVHTTRVQYPSKNGSFASTDGEGQHKTAELVLDEDLERGVES